MFHAGFFARRELRLSFARELARLCIHTGLKLQARLFLFYDHRFYLHLCTLLYTPMLKDR